jgi:hypothetical protein
LVSDKSWILVAKITYEEREKAKRAATFSGRVELSIYRALSGNPGTRLAAITY